MRWSRGAASAAVLVAVMALSACTGGSGAKPSRSAGTTAPAATTPSATASSPLVTTTVTTPKPTPSKTVPVDQIPPGNPTNWVPAGVPTTAKYKEPGDVVPKFTRGMFQNNYSGALAVMTYYFEAVNWDAATGATPSIYKSFCPKACDQELKYSLQRIARHEHYKGGRYISGSPIIVPNPNGSGAAWGGQFHVTVKPGEILGFKDQIVHSFEKSIVGLELDVKFNGTLWNVVGIYFVS